MWFSQTVAFTLSVICILCFSLFFTLLTLLIIQCIQKEKWKKPLFTVQKLSIFLGILILVIGIVAYLVKQDFHVWFPLCMAGLLLISLMSLQLLLCTRIFHTQVKKTSSDLDEKKNAPKTEVKKRDYQSIYSKKA